MAHISRCSVLLSRLAVSRAGLEQLSFYGLPAASSIGLYSAAVSLYAPYNPAQNWSGGETARGPCQGGACGILSLRSFHSSPVSSAKDYYDVLGVKNNASDADIKKAYYKLAKQYHPDANQGDKEAEAKFQEVGKAYDTLRDKEKRAIYDQVGPEGMESGAGDHPGGGFGFGGGFGGGNFYGASDDFSQDQARDLFEQFFGQMGRGGGRASAGGFGFSPFGGFHFQEDPVSAGHVGEDIQARLRISFIDAAKGKEEKVSMSNIPGGGAPKDPIDIKIPAGIQGGQRLQVAKAGLKARNKDGTPGDLYLTVEVEKHPIFRRDGFDIHMDQPVDFVDAILGTNIRVPTIDGNVDVAVKAGTQHGDRLRLRGKGAFMEVVGRPDQRGDQFVRVTVSLPRSVTDTQRELLQEFAREREQKKAA